MRRARGLVAAAAVGVTPLLVASFAVARSSSSTDDHVAAARAVLV